MDVRGVLRRTRLSLVASLFLALLGGAGVSAAVVEPSPVPVTAAVAAPVVTPALEVPVADLTASSLLATAPATGPVVALPLALLLPTAGAPARVARLTSQVSDSATGPRAPPAPA